jgi:hypothetical protein
MISEVFRISETQVFLAAANITGIAPVGTDSGATYLRGAYRKFTDCTDGGLFRQPVDTAVNDSLSGRVKTIIWNLAGAANITFAWVDMDGVVIPFWPQTGAVLPVAGFFDPQQTVLIPPQGYLRVTATGPITGAINVVWDYGFTQDLFQQIPGLGFSSHVSP